MTFSEDRYSAAVADLFGKHRSVQAAGFTGDAYKPGLDGMCALDAALGSPSRSLRAVHVAGTNGKGSVCSMIAASLAAEGYRVGLYTSPHLLDFRERMKVVTASGFTMIPKERVWEFLQDVSLEGLSFFEITTGLAFLWFREMEVDWAVVEVGLGGRLDSTNILTPAISVITSIGLDHCAIFGDTVEKIAFEKAGIFKKGVPALVWGHNPVTDPVFARVAAGTGAVLHFAEDCGRGDLLGRMDLKGPCQKSNLSTTLSALALLGHIPSEDGIIRAAEMTGLEGRWQEMTVNGRRLILDIGHNPAAIAVNFSGCEAAAVVYGVMADKDVDAIAALLPASPRYFLVAPQTDRALPAQELKDRLAGLRPELVAESCAGVAEGLAAALESTPEGETIYVGGSAFVVAEALAALKTM
ncbi:MAG: bifunctional folylpolyglutamate synthase/dihydrofolate synthase [Bacteroidales bacterium]|nr:bifunctional folylpolyglutamate synthase/dihydrofolate synthase [Bacteroidales bacterium]